MSNSENNKRIVRNTAALYVRMLLMMAISLYTSRVVLQTLGVVDYGIYNVVGGVVTMIAFLNGALSTATQRYLNYEMGKGNSDGLSKVFSMSFWCFCMIALAAVIVAETVGLWFVINKLNIPAERADVALWVYHISVLTFVVELLVVPYKASIIAHEKMSVYAYISIAEVSLKLILIYLLVVIDADKLRLYASMMFIATLLICYIDKLYCSRHFAECNVRLVWDRMLFKGLFSFSGWMLVGTITYILSTQGVNMLINIFFGAAVNAARGIALQVSNAINSFVTNFMMAVRPQIVKSYANGEHEYMYKLVFSSSKLSFYLLLIFTTPVFFYAEPVLGLWLDTVPEYTVLFTRLVLISTLVTTFYTPIGYASQASGKIRDYQLTIAAGFLLIFVCTYFLYKLGYGVEWTFYIAILIDIIGLLVRLVLLKKVIDFPLWPYLKTVGVPIVVIFTLVYFLSFAYKCFFVPSSFFSVVLGVGWCGIIAAALSLLFGLDHSEKRLIKKGIQMILKRK